MSNRGPGRMDAEEWQELPGHSLVVCCDECEWEATGDDEDELAGQYRSHMSSEHGENLSMEECRGMIEDVALS